MELWRSLPTWAKWAVGITAVIAVQALSVAWDEYRFVAAFAEEFVARLIYLGLMFGPLAAGVATGLWVARRTKTWIGWVIGIAIAVVVFEVVFRTAPHIPGVGWRFEWAWHEDRETGDGDWGR